MSQLPEAVIRQLPKVEGFDIEWRLKYSGTTDLDKRVMTFIDNLWGIEVTGGIDQFERLTIIAVKKTGLARRAGIRVGDIITKINDTPADNMTLLEAQLEIHESGRFVKIFVKGDEDEDSDDENTVDFYFKPPLLYQGFPWNDRRRPMYKESNCYMVPSKVIAKIEREIKLKATREEYVNNLMAMAAAKEERIRQAKRDQEDEQEAIEMAQFEAIARANKSKSNEAVTEEFSKIVESTEQYTESVKDDSRAGKAGLKLGDSIVSINGKDTSFMTLNDANVYLKDASEQNITLQVIKFDEKANETDKPLLHEIVLEVPNSNSELDKKLKLMQQQLLEMTNIPDELQSKITMVTKALEQFMTMDTESLSSYGSYDYVDESRDRSSEKQFSSIPEEDEDIESQESIDDEHSIQSDDDNDYVLKHATNKTSVSLDDIKSTANVVMNDNTAFVHERECSEESICETIKSEEELKMEEEKLKKQQKIQTLEQSWQRLCGNTKTIYKRSNCHLVPSSALKTNKINQLNEEKVISFYTRKCIPQNN
ncbi:unnamed protein product [Diamesa tonsa]